MILAGTNILRLSSNIPNLVHDFAVLCYDIDIPTIHFGMGSQCQGHRIPVRVATNLVYIMSVPVSHDE